MEPKGTCVELVTPPGHPNKAVEAPRWFRSKTFWFNLISTLVALAETSELVNLVPGHEPKLLFAVTAGNIVLRLWFTKAPVTT